MLWSCRGFGKNIVEETLHYHSSRFERNFGRTSLFSFYTRGEISLLCISDFCLSHKLFMREQKTPDIRIDITAHVMQCRKEANTFLA